MGDPVPTTGSTGLLRADTEAMDPRWMDRGDMRLAHKRGVLPTGRDMLLAMHYRMVKSVEIARRFQLSREEFAQVMKEQYDESDKEISLAPESVQQEVGGMLTRWLRRIDKSLDPDNKKEVADQIKEIKVGLAVASNLAKLVGANAATKHEVRSLSVTVDAEQTHAYLKDPVMRKLQLEMENRRIQLEQQGQPIDVEGPATDA